MAITLNTNFVFGTLSNMIISTQVFSDGIGELGGVYSNRKVDGTLYGDTKRYISTDALRSYPWDGTDETGGYNLLTIKRPPAPVEQTLVIDQFRQIPVTIDDYLTKQAFSDEGSFSAFNGVVLGWLSTTKRVYEHTKFTTDIIVSGLDGATAFPDIVLDTPDDVTITGYDLLKYRAQELYKQLEDNIKELSEPSRDYNDNGFLRTYKMEDFDIIAPLGVLSSVRKHDLPFLYNQDDKPLFKEVHWKYFGEINDTSGTTGASNKTVRSLIETDYGTAPNVVHVFPGDLLPDSTAYAANETYTCDYEARPSLNDEVTLLLVHKKDFPIMSAFTVGTSFFNARRLDINHYLTFGHNNVYDAHIGEYALLKVSTSITPSNE